MPSMGFDPAYRLSVMGVLSGPILAYIDRVTGDGLVSLRRLCALGGAIRQGPFASKGLPN